MSNIRDIQRKFALDHPEAFGDEEEGNENIDTTMGVGGLPSRKRTRTGGRVGKGQDFWSQVDVFFAERIKEFNSRNLTSSNWKRCVLTITTTCHFDVHNVTVTLIF